MITPEEEQRIIDKAVEKALLSLPEVVGNLMTQHSALVKMNSDFYKEHQEFVNHKDVVASVIEGIDGKYPLLDYKEKLEKAVPEIRQRIKTISSLDTASVSNHPKRDFKDFSVPDAKRPSNGAL